MPRSQQKQQPSKKPKPKRGGEGGGASPDQGTRLPATGEAVRTAYVATQIKLLQRDLTPVDYARLDFGSLESIKRFNEHITHLCMRRKISGRDYSALQHGIGNAIQILKPPQGVQLTVTQTQTASPTIEAFLLQLMKLMPKLPEDEQVVLARAVKRIEQQDQRAT